MYARCEMILSTLALLLPLSAEAASVRLLPVDWQENPNKQIVTVQVTGTFVDGEDVASKSGERCGR